MLAKVVMEGGEGEGWNFRWRFGAGKVPPQVMSQVPVLKEAQTEPSRIWEQLFWAKQVKWFLWFNYKTKRFQRPGAGS